MLVDSKQRINGSLIFLLEFYKILMGTFLTIFVPHSCGAKTCTMTENINNGNPYHRSVLIVNAVSFGVFLMMYYSEVKRENWCISYLDIDPKKPIEHLDVEIEGYPKIKKRMSKLNTQYKNLTIMCAGVQVANISVSALDVVKFGAGSASYLTMASYIVLIATKLIGSYSTASTSLTKERAYSAYLSGPKTYNVIDMDHKDDNVATIMELADLSTGDEVRTSDDNKDDTSNIKIILD
jgi:hypothetical protein|tara:strand:+ start:865 stop:1575 length:711 start_codon:yes stop_codon:yes gene_type:complete